MGVLDGGVDVVEDIIQMILPIHVLHYPCGRV